MKTGPRLEYCCHLSARDGKANGPSYLQQTLKDSFSVFLLLFGIISSGWVMRRRLLGSPLGESFDSVRVWLLLLRGEFPHLYYLAARAGLRATSNGSGEWGGGNCVLLGIESKGSSSCSLWNLRNIFTIFSGCNVNSRQRDSRKARNSCRLNVYAIFLIYSYPCFPKELAAPTHVYIHAKVWQRDNGNLEQWL